jgi:hypothetical protein
MVCAFALPSFANSGPWSANLPTYRNPQMLLSGTKTTSGQNASVTLSTMGGSYTNAYFYVEDGTSIVTTQPSPIAYVGGTAVTLAYTTTPKTNDTSLHLYGGNNSYTYVVVSATGNVDFS